MDKNRKRRVEEMAAAKGYYVDADGKAFGPNGMLRPYGGSDGYARFTVRDDTNRCLKVKVHRMQAFQQYGQAIYEPGIVVRHLDGNKFNNSGSNIAIGTYSDNSFDRPMEHRVAHARVATSYVRKLSDDDVARMRALRAEGSKIDDLASLFGVSKGCVSDICAHKQRQVSATQ